MEDRLRRREGQWGLLRETRTDAEDDFAVVCVLHGDPVLPAWLRSPALASRLHLVVNDPAPDRYRELPAAVEVVVNAAVAGFADNVSQALDRIWPAGPAGPPVVLCVNFDLELAPSALSTLAAVLRDNPRAAAAAPRLQDGSGQPVLSAGGGPTALKEFTRAAGLRTGGPQRVVRAVLRRLPAWQRRNAGGGPLRVLTDEEYLPWTCVAVRREAWQQVGGLDRRFPMYAEDIDWGRRVAAAGWQCLLVDAGPVVHEERATQDARTNALYELSHLRLHEKWGRPDLARWQRAGLVVRRSWPWRRWAPVLDDRVLAGDRR